MILVRRRLLAPLMRTQSQTAVDLLAAPASDGEVLVWPPADDIVRLIDENRRRRRGYEFELLGRPVDGLLEANPTGEPVILTGHQPGFIHPGVWAKSVAAGRLTAKVGGRASFLAVDGDAVRQLALTWPVEDAGRYRIRSVEPFEGGHDLSYLQLPELPAGRWDELFAGPLATLPESSRTTFREFVRGFLSERASGIPDDGPKADYLLRWHGGMSAMEDCVGVRTLPLVLQSRALAIPRNESIAVFFAHLLLHADSFAACYNAALTEYRRRRGIRSRLHPVPDLVIADGRIELPLWLMRGAGPRMRLSISSIADEAVTIWAGLEPVCTRPRREFTARPSQTLNEALGDWQLLPRALTLTMYLRLFACDLFIHGIGGAKYDQITDDVIRRFFGVEPPGYACVSATLRLPLRVHPVSEQDRAAGRRRVRDAAWNPQRHLVGAVSGELAALVAERADAVVESDFLRRETRHARSARREAFNRIRQAVGSITAAAPGLIEAARADWDRVVRCLEDNRVAESREWFFALYPIEKLRALAAGLPF